MRPMIVPGLVIGVAAVALAACGSARRVEPIVGPTPMTTAELANGQIAFMAKCHQCHPKGEAGLAPAINDKPLPGFMIRLQVRAGFGAMPSFPEYEISEAELADIVSYLYALRESG